MAVCVHRINFFRPVVKDILRISYDEFSTRLAVARGDFSIEIYDLKGLPFLERVIPRCSGRHVQTVVFCNGRLFSAGFQGQITEYNLETLLPRYDVTVVAGCSIWCMAVNKQKTHLAVGTEDGVVCIFSICSNELCFEKNLERQKGRVLSLAWHESGDFIVTGSLDIISILNVKTGMSVERITVGRKTPEKETRVWCLAITSDMTIISGDSRGNTSFWDGKTGTLISSSSDHAADVLELCLHKDGKVVCSSGVDPVIITYGLTVEGLRPKWMRSKKYFLHCHDVKGLALTEDFLISGGVAGSLVFQKHSPFSVIKLSPFSEVGYCSVAPTASCIMLRYSGEIQVWKLEETDGILGTDIGSGTLAQPLKIASFQTKSNEYILCCAISHDGKWIAYSNTHKLLLFHCNMEGKSYAIKKVRIPLKCAVSSLAFIPGKSHLIISTTTGTLHQLECDLDSPILKEFKSNTDAVERQHLLAVCMKFVASADHNGNIHIYNLKSLSLYCSLPKYKFQATAMEFDRIGENLAVAYSDRMVLEYAVKIKSITKLHKILQDVCHYPIIGITFSPENEIKVHDQRSIYSIICSEKNEPPMKKIQLEGECNSAKEDITETTFRKCDRYNYLLSFKYMKDSAIALEVHSDDIKTQLPPALFKKQFGV